MLYLLYLVYSHVYLHTSEFIHQVSEFLSATVANFLKLMAKSRNTSPEMIMAAALPTTAACMGTKAGLQLKPYSDYVISGNLFMIGKSFISSFS